jgi:outer membrane lipoprotein-sorting protein
MKKLILAVTGLIAFTLINAQSLDEIVKKYSAATKQDKLAAISSIKLTAKMSMMGMEMPIVMWMKNPDKIKSVTTMNGQDIIQVFDGVKGYLVSPMTGSSAPVEMTPDQVKQTMSQSIFQNKLAAYLKDGKLTLEGEEKVNDKPAFKLKAIIEGGNTAYMFIDKESFYLVKTSATMNQGGQTVTVDSYPTDYKETGGIILPMKTTASVSGMEMVTTFDKVEINIPMDDSLFKIK